MARGAGSSSASAARRSSRRATSDRPPSPGSRAIRLAVASPMPLEAPVIRAVIALIARHSTGAPFDLSSARRTRLDTGTLTAPGWRVGSRHNGGRPGTRRRTAAELRAAPGRRLVRVRPAARVRRRGLRGGRGRARPRRRPRLDARPDGPDGAHGPRPAPRRDLPPAGDHLRDLRPERRRPRPALPARPRPADHPRQRMGGDRGRPEAADPGSQRLPRRHVPRPRDRSRGDRPLGAGARLARVPPRRPRDPPARWHLLPRRRMRPRPRRRWPLEGARGQRPHPLGDLLRAREPPGDDPACPGDVHRLSGATGGSLPAAAPERAPRGRAGARARADRGRLDARAGEQRLLRALVPRPADGRRAGRGHRPRRPRRHLLHAHHRGALASRRDLPPPRRRLHRSARVPSRLAARRARADPRLPGGHGRRWRTRSAPGSPTTRPSTAACPR